MSHKELDLRLRDSTEADAAVIAEIYNESVVAGDATMDENPKSTSDIQRLFAGFNSRETILVLENSEEVLGWGIIKRYSDRPGYRLTCETAVYLRRSRIGLGLGSTIKRALIERCRSLGYHHLVAKIFADNTRSIEYNQKFGYQLVGVQKEVGTRNGEWVDIAILQLLLKEEAHNVPWQEPSGAPRPIQQGETD